MIIKNYSSPTFYYCDTNKVEDRPISGTGVLYFVCLYEKYISLLQFSCNAGTT